MLSVKTSKAVGWDTKTNKICGFLDLHDYAGICLMLSHIGARVDGNMNGISLSWLKLLVWILITLLFGISFEKSFQ